MHRPGIHPGARARHSLLLLAAAAGWLHAASWALDRSRDCRLSLSDGDSLVVAGRVSGAWSRGVVVDVRRGLPGGCREALRIRPRSGATDLPPPGSAVEVRGRWRSWDLGPDPDLAGELRGRIAVDAEGDGAERGPGARLVEWRSAVRGRLAGLFPERHGLVAALVLARRDGVSPETRESFTRAGVAHLLAISGFHVGIIAAVVLGALRACGLRRRPAVVAGAFAVGGYVAFIGAPDAAVRASLILGLVAAGILRGRPAHRAGALAAALLLFVWIDPGAPGRVGFQLSFLGAAGLVAWTPVVDRILVRWLRWRRGRAVRGALAVGVAATLATLPAVAWHFERVSLIGIPVTLLSTPLIAVALPGVLAATLADLLPLPGFVPAFLAGGADLLLGLLVATVERSAALSWASVPVARHLVVTAAGGVTGALLVLVPARGVGREVRLVTAVAGAVCAAGLSAPLAARMGSGTLEIVALDVGQGDAIALRSPRGRWLLVDAGPPAFGGPSEPPPAASRLRSRGVRRLAGLLLTHPDLDHIGGAAPIVEAFDPAFVAGPGHVRGTSAYVEALTAGVGAGDRAPPWLALRRGDRLDLDGVELEVLHPDVLAPADDPNGSSLVLRVRWGPFHALLTGDAPSAVEDAVAAAVGDVDLLKVGHHGSLTSTSPGFLAVVRPEVALVSVGRRNRYGHPHPVVLRRLGEVAEEVLRTDRDGSIRVVVRPDGRWSARSDPGSWWR